VVLADVTLLRHIAIVPVYLTLCTDFTEITRAGEAEGIDEITEHPTRVSGDLVERLEPAGSKPLTERAMRELMLLPSITDITNVL
jgi:hypothetical protein